MNLDHLPSLLDLGSSTRKSYSTCDLAFSISEQKDTHRFWIRFTQKLMDRLGWKVGTRINLIGLEDKFLYLVPNPAKGIAISRNGKRGTTYRTSIQMHKDMPFVHERVATSESLFEIYKGNSIKALVPDHMLLLEHRLPSLLGDK